MTYSPLLSVITAAVEIAAAVWTFTGIGRKAVKRTAGAILLLLASYQILEVLICAATPPSLLLSRISFMSVAWLPPLGILLISILAGSTPARIYAAGLLFASLVLNLIILLTPDFVGQTTCRVVFALFRNHHASFLAYCIFYWLGLLGMAGFSLSGSRSASARDKQQLRLMAAGSLGFIVPSLVTVLLFPSVTTGSLPSIMCHYALFLALALIILIRREKNN
ncbi:hypothetical protein JXO52_12555 [bacterium]|nr:hypothetical protein [bacterium]